MKPIAFFPLAVLLISTTRPAGAAEGEPPKRVVPWDVAALSRPPKVHPTEERPAKEMRAFFYEGAEYKGKPTRVFAYYAAPKGTPPGDAIPNAGRGR